mmetsp:Transcript_57643/g.171981  ORF Transcript_57643/g.171981 Transcript_57643/m.171981 type:complete len:574 (-) Transcript_57643:124-1845(-)
MAHHGIVVAVDVLHFRAQRVQVQAQLSMALPIVFVGEADAGFEIRPGGQECGHGRGRLSGHETQLGETDLFPSVRHESRSTVQLVDQNEEVFLDLLGRRLSPHGPSGPQVKGIALRLGNEAVGRALDLIVRESIRTVSVLDHEPLRDGGVQCGDGALHRSRGVGVDDSQHPLLAVRAERRDDPERLVNLRREPQELGRHELNDVCADLPAPYAVKVPLPPPRREGIPQQALVVERMEQLFDEEGVPARLVQHGPRQGPRRPGEGAYRIGYQGIHALQSQIVEVYRSYGHASRTLKIVNITHQRAFRPDLVGAVAPDDQEPRQTRVGGERSHQLERLLVGPLQVVEEQHHRRIRAAARGPEEHLNEELQAPLGVLPGDEGRRRPSVGGAGEDRPEVRDEVGEGPSLGPHARLDRLPISIDPEGVVPQKAAVIVEGAHDGAQGLHLTHGIELSRDEPGPPRDVFRPRLQDEGRLSRAGIPGDQGHPVAVVVAAVVPGGRKRTVEGPEERGHFLLPPVQRQRRNNEPGRLDLDPDPHPDPDPGRGRGGGGTDGSPVDYDLGPPRGRGGWNAAARRR